MFEKYIPVTWRHYGFWNLIKLPNYGYKMLTLRQTCQSTNCASYIFIFIKWLKKHEEVLIHIELTTITRRAQHVVPKLKALPADIPAVLGRHQTRGVSYLCRWRLLDEQIMPWNTTQCVHIPKLVKCAHITAQCAIRFLVVSLLSRFQHWCTNLPSKR